MRDLDTIISDNLNPLAFRHRRDKEARAERRDHNASLRAERTKARAASNGRPWPEYNRPRDVVVREAYEGGRRHG